MKYLIITILSLSILLTACKKEEVSDNNKVNNTTKQIDNSTITQKVSSSTQENQNDVDCDDWKTYRNEEYGFEFKYPAYAIAYIKYWDGNYKKCNIKAKNSFLVPYDVFFKNGDFYLREQYFYNKESCEKELNSYNMINEDESEILTPWHLRVVNVDNDDELGNFIKKNFGESCTYNKNKTRDGIFSIVIQGDGKSLADTNCPVNYESILKYDSKNKRLIYWNLGQECILKKLDSECIDDEVVDSFRFIESNKDTKIYTNNQQNYSLWIPKNYTIQNITNKCVGDNSKNCPWYNRDDYLLSDVEFNDINLKGNVAFGLKIFNTMDESKIKASGGWESIKNIGEKKIGKYNVKIFAIDKGVPEMGVIFNNGKSYVFLHYLTSKKIEEIISTFKIID